MPGAILNTGGVGALIVTGVMLIEIALKVDEDAMGEGEDVEGSRMSWGRGNRCSRC